MLLQDKFIFSIDGWVVYDILESALSSEKDFHDLAIQLIDQYYAGDLCEHVVRIEPITSEVERNFFPFLWKGDKNDRHIAILVKQEKIVYETKLS